jgi:hypothetical protein
VTLGEWERKLTWLPAGKEAKLVTVGVPGAPKFVGWDLPNPEITAHHRRSCGRGTTPPAFLEFALMPDDIAAAII